MDGVIIQVPVSSALRAQASESATAQGFSSLQEAIRIFLTNLAARKIAVTFTPDVSLSNKNDIRYAKMLEDVNKGKVSTKSFKNTASLMTHLKS